MGSEFLTIDQSAEMLGRSKKTIHSYMANGILRRVQEPVGNRAGRPRILIPLADVEELAVTLGAGFPPMNRKSFFQLWAHVQRLEAEMAAVKKILGFGGSPLRPSRAEAVGFYEAAVKAIKDTQWRLEEISAWADLYERFDEVFFDILFSYVPDEPWKAFYNLCIAQMKQVSGDQSFSTSLELQTLYQRLGQGIKLIRQAIILLIEAGHGKADEETLVRVDGPKAALLRHLSVKAVNTKG